MSANTFLTISNTALFATWVNAYNTLISEINTDTLRTNKTFVANISFSNNVDLQVAGMVLPPQAISNASASVNQLEHRITSGTTGSLYFNKKQIRFISPYPAVYGYIFGGYTNTSTFVATTESITFSTGTTAAHTPANLSQARAGGVGVSDTKTYGYVNGGDTGTIVYVGTTDRITFSTRVNAAHTPANTLGENSGYSIGLSDGVFYGYCLHGLTTGIDFPQSSSLSEQIAFATGTRGATPFGTWYGFSGFQGISDGAVYGYLPRLSTSGSTHRVTYSTQIFASASVSNLITIFSDFSSCSDTKTYGYAMGGSDGVSSTLLVNAERISYSSGIFAAQSTANISTGRVSGSGTSDGVTYGYALGGGTGTSYTPVNTIDRLTFSTSTTAAQTATLATARKQAAKINDFVV